MEKKYYINDIAKKFNISEHTLRYYDKKMLLKNFKRDDNGYRYLNEDDLRTIEVIICLKKTNMSLEDIKHYLKLVEQGRDTLKERQQMIEKQLQEAHSIRKDIDDQIVYLEYKLKFYDDLIKEN
ncbi:MerR family transcriptional regulator [Spiroplasma chinense]|uniref:MerR family transcriptional regulator n=1 Tax=Spiroplasma chinense TaxID=216932 RepID=A0A5B9Y3B5_9MOLU|nr:MerR family transcriptional regulator [Spiroplasma chinense]QEH61243.1 MerR family transcriptional regulator [Spiroplasma chinense]